MLQKVLGIRLRVDRHAQRYQIRRLLGARSTHRRQACHRNQLRPRGRREQPRPPPRALLRLGKDRRATSKGKLLHGARRARYVFVIESSHSISSSRSMRTRLPAAHRPLRHGRPGRGPLQQHERCCRPRANRRVVQRDSCPTRAAHAERAGHGCGSRAGDAVDVCLWQVARIVEQATDGMLFRTFARGSLGGSAARPDRADVLVGVAVTRTTRPAPGRLVPAHGRRPRPSASASVRDGGTAAGRLPQAVPPEYKVFTHIRTPLVSKKLIDPSCVASAALVAAATTMQRPRGPIYCALRAPTPSGRTTVVIIKTVDWHT